MRPENNCSQSIENSSAALVLDCPDDNALALGKLLHTSLVIVGDLVS